MKLLLHHIAIHWHDIFVHALQDFPKNRDLLAAFWNKVSYLQ